MVVLAIGDICAENGLSFLEKKLPLLRKLYSVELTIANGENSAPGGLGINASGAARIFSSGVDIITMGNHSFFTRGYENMYSSTYGLLRPYNLGKGIPGVGSIVYDKGRFSVLIVNLMGYAYMNLPVTNCYDAMDEILAGAGTKIVIVDFHAEYTSEKIAFARNYDGKASLIFGTHTHVQTADERIFPGGTAYITDIGMTGAKESVIGVDISLAIRRQRYAVPTRLTPAVGESILTGILVDIDEVTGRAKSIERISIED